MSLSSSTPSSSVLDLLHSFKEVVIICIKNPSAHKLEIVCSIGTLLSSIYIIHQIRKRKRIHKTVQQQQQPQPQNDNEKENENKQSSSSVSYYDHYPRIPILNIPLNYQFTSKKGLARHMLGGFGFGFVFGMSLTALIHCMFLIQNNSDSNGSTATATTITTTANNSTTKPVPVVGNFLMRVILPKIQSIFFFDDKSVIHQHLILKLLRKSSYVPLLLYSLAASVFFSLEYLWCALFHPPDLDFNSFLFYTHSKELHLATIVCLLEYAIELKFFPKLKLFSKMHCVGLCLVLVGQYFRTAAEFTAGSNFNHLVQTEKHSKHVLVKRGVYKYFRHPSYFGFFYWSIGVQLLMGNPICFVAHSVMCWDFFRDRIPHEEAYLVDFFGEEYEEYRRKTFIGIPFM